MTQLELTTPAADIRPRPGGDQPLPDPALFWSWAGRAARPWLGRALALVGLIVIFVGWFGVSGQALVAKQLPYLISGGLGGVALVGIGVALISAERRHQDAERIERLEEMVTELRSVLLAYPDAAPDREAPRVAAPAAATSPYEALGHDQQAHVGNGWAPAAGPGPGGPVAIPTGTTFHSPGCQMVRGKQGVETVGADAIDRRGLAACRICEPALPGA